MQENINYLECDICRKSTFYGPEPGAWSEDELIGGAIDVAGWYQVISLMHESLVVCSNKCLGKFSRSPSAYT